MQLKTSQRLIESNISSTKIDLKLIFDNKNNPQALIRVLVEKEMIPSVTNRICGLCGVQGEMTFVTDRNVIDGCRLQCKHKIERIVDGKITRKMCGHRISVRTGTFFSKSKLQLSQILQLIYYTVMQMPQNSIKEIGCHGTHTMVDWQNFVREVIKNYYYDKVEALGGPGEVVEIDESKFGRRKYHKGHLVEGIWIWGGIERSSGRVIMCPVQYRDKRTLHALIKRWIKPGTTILSDCWAAYNGLEELGYKHLKVNHSKNFKDPVTGACTNRIESSWRHAKH
uniref:ISXO2-like transposase domain-containing protein n=1 Tax=Panagrolaimus davidi TaxID=227884 RepID=A0A914PMU4_9BILA